MTVKEYSEQAEFCRAQAERAASPLDRELWLTMAEDWERLVRQIEAVSLPTSSPSIKR
jgi:hypothetical protein